MLGRQAAVPSTLVTAFKYVVRFIDVEQLLNLGQVIICLGWAMTLL